MTIDTPESLSLGSRVRKGMWELAQLDFDDVEPSVKVPDGYEALAEMENRLALAEEDGQLLRNAISTLIAECDALKAERDEAVHAYQMLDGVREQLAREMDAHAAADARVEAAEQALREIADRHPDATEGEHPAVDIARAALTRSGGEQ